MKQLIVKGNMPQDCCFYAVRYEDGNIVFSTVDNSKKVLVKKDFGYEEEYLPEAHNSTIIKSEDELIEKLLTTKYHDDKEEIELFTKRFNKFSWCFLKALSVSGSSIAMHYKKALKSVI